jgi:quercetin dioxygenase-like cupin family protein
MNRIKQGSLSFAAAVGLIGCGAVTAVAQDQPKENKGLVAVELRSIDLTSEIDSVQGRRLRLRTLTLEPGGIVAVHSHKDRPTVLHVIKGTLTSHPQGKPVQVLSAGDGLAEGKDANHWVQNTGNDKAEFITVDVYKD